MQFIVNSTFTINIINTDISIIADLKFATIQDVLEETSYETGLEITNEIAIKKLSSKLKIDTLKISASKQRLLSSTDKKLLYLANKNKRSRLLITDDKV
ncbi:MAG: hypothetical protein KAJ51_07875, partial [Thermoplasmata archaeon]|nr:hypothetical protein [Thermoplasmata archaeon]